MYPKFELTNEGEEKKTVQINCACAFALAASAAGTVEVTWFVSISHMLKPFGIWFNFHFAQFNIFARHLIFNL